MATFSIMIAVGGPKGSLYELWREDPGYKFTLLGYYPTRAEAEEAMTCLDCAINGELVADTRGWGHMYEQA